MENIINPEQVKAEFLSILRAKVTRPGVDKLITYLERQSDFFTAPASTKYHLACEGGLAQHSLNVYYALVREYEQNKHSYNFDRLNYTEEALAIVALLHDLCKCNVYHKGLRNVKNQETGKWESVPTWTFDDPLPYGHGAKSVYILSSFIKLSRDEALAIRFHMGFSATDATTADVGKAFQICPLAFLLHIADGFASYYLEGEG